uniref:Secreted protein n=1 Tax=Achlya hypogyna TaxID=1202772 RepID=A0A0A7CN28_ACHHY|nr:secreted protein [Achlya hypogyna]
MLPRLVSILAALLCVVAAENFPTLDPHAFTNDDVVEATECQAGTSDPLRGLAPGAFARSSFFNCFRDDAQIYAFVDAMAAAAPKKTLTKFTVGTTYLGRPIFGYKLSPPKANGEAIYVQGLQHAREWISGITVVYALARLLDELASSTAPAQSYTWYFVPIVNLDGYSKTWNSMERYRRKNLRPVPAEYPYLANQAEPGVDLNRNWGPVSQFDVVQVPGYDLTYAGTEPFSEPEVSSIHKWLQSHGEIVGYLDVHSYAGLILTPYGDTNTTLPAPFAERYTNLGNAIKQSVNNATGANYGAEPEWFLYMCYGTFEDYVFRTYQKAAITFEVAGEDFVVSNTTILPHGLEVYTMLQTFAEQMPAFYAGLPSPVTKSTTSAAPRPTGHLLLLIGVTLALLNYV